jgi:hypothetical protein
MIRNSGCKNNFGGLELHVKNGKKGGILRNDV